MNKDKIIKQLQAENKAAVWILALIIVVALVMIIGLVIQIAVERSNGDKNIQVPKVSGVYTPLEADDNYIVIVLDKRIDMHRQLLTQIQNALNQINAQLKLRGG